MSSSRPRSKKTQAQYAAYAAVVQAAEEMQRGFAELLKPFDLSPTQYNVLRILRGGGAEGLTCGDVGNRLIQHDPDVTRLLDRLDQRGLIERARDAKDRRVVRTRITGDGLALLGKLDTSVDDLHERQLGHVTEKRLASLASLITEVRARLP